jgi:hypothetical protein
METWETWLGGRARATPRADRNQANQALIRGTSQALFYHHGSTHL